MISAAKLRTEVTTHYPRMEGIPAYRAEVLADLNGVTQEAVIAILLGSGLAEEPDFCPHRRPRKKVEWSSMEPLYVFGLNDLEIAEHCGCSASTVSTRRKEQGLPANGTTAARKLDDETTWALYRLGLNDREIGSRLHVSSGLIRKWRDRNGLESNHCGRGEALSHIVPRKAAQA